MVIPRPDKSSLCGVETRHRNILMRETSMKVIVLACNRYTWLVPISLHFYIKYWRDNPYQTEIVAEADYKGGANFDAHGGDWSSWVLNYLRQSKESKFLLIMEDFIIRKPIDTRKVKIAEKLCEGNVGCVRLNGPDKWFRRHAIKTDAEGFGEYPLDKRYSMSLQVSIWQKQYLLDILRENESAWQTEHKGSERLKELKGKWRILWSESTIIDYNPTGLMSKGELFLPTVKWTMQELLKNG